MPSLSNEQQKLIYEIDNFKRKTMEIFNCPHKYSKHYAKVTLSCYYHISIKIFYTGYVQSLLSQVWQE